MALFWRLVIARERPPTERRSWRLRPMLLVLSCAVALCPSVRVLSTARLPTARAGVAVALDSGSLVQFEKRKGEVSLGALVSPDEKSKRNWLIVDGAGNSHSVPPKAIRLAVPGSKATKAAEVAAHESAAAEALETQAEALDDVWDLALEDESSELELPALAELFFGSAGSTDCYAALALLESAQGRCLFKVKVVKSGGDAGVGFLPRPREEAGALKAQLEREESAAEAGKALQRRIDECIELRLGGVGAAPFDVEAEAEEVREGFEALARLGCRCDGPDKRDMDEPEAADEEAARFLQTIDRKGTPAAARQLLRQLGLWELSTEAMLPMLRQRVPIDFSEELLEDARLLNEAPPPDEDEAARRDLTGLLSLAIDDPSTLEVDDAVSIEVLEGGKQRLWVHIADPTRYITAGSSLDVEAQRRLSSIYVPSGVVPMLPLSISAGLLSLRPGVEACALSFGIMLHADGGIEEGAVGGWGGDSDAADEKAAVVVTTSRVRATRLSYAHVDALLRRAAREAGGAEADFEGGGGAEAGTDGEAAVVAAAEAALAEQGVELAEAVETLVRLKQMSAARLQWRIEGQSMESLAPRNLPDMQVKARRLGEAAAEGAEEAPFEDGWSVMVRPEGGDSVTGEARLIVTEAMVVCSEAAARYGMEADLPLPFRGQCMKPVDEEALKAVPDGPCRTWFAIGCMYPMSISPKPLPHEGLGIDEYAQATSPIRRYSDLMVHRQIKAHLRGAPLPYPTKEGGGDSLIVTIAKDAGAGAARKYERYANDFWIAEFLRRRYRADRSTAWEAMVLGTRWGDKVTMVLVHELGAVLSIESPSTPLAIGESVRVAPTPAGDLCVV